MIPIPDEFNYIAPAITSKMKNPKKPRVKNKKMTASSRYGKEKNQLKEQYTDLRPRP